MLRLHARHDQFRDYGSLQCVQCFQYVQAHELLALQLLICSQLHESPHDVPLQQWPE